MAFEKLDIELKKIFYGLLKEQHEFSGFFEYIQFNLDESSVESLNSNLEPLIKSLTCISVSRHYAINLVLNNVLTALPNLMPMPI